MYFRLIIFITLVTFCTNTFAQQNPTLFSIDGNNIGLNEFKRAFDKTNQLELDDNKEATRNFLNQYINFKLKVAEARKLSLNRDEKFRKLVEAYKKSIVKTYVTDAETINRLASQAYRRMKTEIQLRHILIKVHRYADPKDTLIAYQKALGIRKNLVNGKNFNELATEVSDDSDAINNKGELGYISAFNLPYAIENYIYNSNSDKYSLPLRSYSGYHLVKIIKKRPAPGYFKVAHIMLMHPNDTSKRARDDVKKKIDEIYRKLIIGEDFKLLAQKYSEDISSSKNGDELPWFGTGQMPTEFEEACINISTGSFSRPIKTRFGWHIIKKADQKELAPYQIVKEQVENIVRHSRRGKIAQNKAIKELKKNYQFKDFQSLSLVWKLVDSTIFEAKWVNQNVVDLNEKLFEFNNRAYFQKDFVKSLKDNQEISFPIPVKNYVYLRYREFVNKILLKFEMEQIEKKNNEIAHLLKSYEEIILANNVMETKVWSKLANNEAGMLSYYNKNKEKYNKSYQADVSIFKYSEELKKIEKQFRKLKKSNASDQEIIARIKANTDITFDLVEKAVKEKGEHTIIDKVIEKYEAGELENSDKMFIFENKKRIVWLNSGITKTNKSLDQVRDKVAEDYELYFEKNWIHQLKRKYKVEISEDVFQSIFGN